MSIIATVSTTVKGTVAVDRAIGGHAQIRLGHTVAISMDMEELRDLCNDIAEVLDTWFEERDRNGK